MRLSAPRSIAAGTVVVLLLARLPLLFQGLWWDEAYTVQVWGQHPDAIRDPDSYLPNNHLLWSLVTAMVRSLAGPEPWALRLLPYLATVAAVALVGVLVRRHLGVDAALVAMLLLVASPTVLELSVQARGYGFGFLAMALVLLASDALLTRPRLADEVVRPAGSRAAWTAGLGLAALAGVTTLPQFAFAVAGVGLVLVADRRARWLGGGALVAAAAGSLVVYAPLVSNLLGQTDRVGTRLAATATPLDLVVLPAVAAVAAVFGDQPVTGVRIVAVVVGLALLGLGGWAWARGFPRRAALLAAPALATAAGFVVLGSSTLPRYTSFIAFPLAALGGGAVTLVPDWLRRAVVAGLAVVALVGTAVRIGDHLLRPQEEVAAVVARALEHDVGVIYVNRSPGHVTFHAALDRAGSDVPVVVSTAVEEPQLCAEVASGTAAFVDYPYSRDAVPRERPACLGEPVLVLDQRLEPGRIALHLAP